MTKGQANTDSTFPAVFKFPLTLHFSLLSLRPSRRCGYFYCPDFYFYD